MKILLSTILWDWSGRPAFSSRYRNYKFLLSAYTGLAIGEETVQPATDSLYQENKIFQSYWSSIDIS